MKLYRHKENGKLYTIGRLINDINFASHKERAGVYADPYKWKGDVIHFRSRVVKACNDFVLETFENACEMDNQQI